MADEKISDIYDLIPASRDHYRYTGDATWYNVNIQMIERTEDKYTGMDPDLLRARFRELTSKRQALRTTMLTGDDGMPVLAALSEIENELFYVDLSGMSRREAAGSNGLTAGQTAYLRNLTQMTLDAGLREGQPLIHIGFIRISDIRYVRWIAASHYILDGTGMIRFENELMSGEGLIDDADSVREYHRRLKRRSRDDTQAYWAPLLEGVGSLTQLPVSEGFVPELHAVIRRKWLGPSLGERIREYCMDHRVTMSAFFIAMIGAAMIEICDEEEVCFFIIGSGRGSDLTDDPLLTGMYMTNLPFVYRRGECPSDCMMQLIGSLEHECIDLDMLGAGFSDPERRRRTVRVDMMNFGGVGAGGVSPDIETYYMDGVVDETSFGQHEYDVNFIVTPGGNYNISYYFNTESCDPAVLDDMSDRFRRIAESFICR